MCVCVCKLAFFFSTVEQTKRKNNNTCLKTIWRILLDAQLNHKQPFFSQFQTKKEGLTL